MCITLRDDASALPLSLSSLGVGTLFDNAWHTFVLTYNGSVFTGYKDGVVGTTPQNYTKTAITVNNVAVGSQKVGGSFSGLFGISCPEIGILSYSATNLATLISDINAYLTREYIA